MNKFRFFSALVFIECWLDMQPLPTRADQPSAVGSVAAAVETPAKGGPKIQFQATSFNFGKTTGVEKLSGVFKFKNAGDSLLKVEPPVPSCDCTESRVKPDSLKPGETGEVLYTIKLDHPVKGQRFIRVNSNDRQTPVVTLTLQLDHTPLYESNPKVVRIMVPAAKEEGQGSFSIGRTDGKPLDIDRVTTSQNWLSASMEPSAPSEPATARVNVIVKRSAQPPAILNATVQLWAAHQTNAPAQTIFVTGEVQGELAAVPGRLYWVIPDFGKDKAKYPEEALTRKVQIISVLGHAFNAKSAVSSIKGMSAQISSNEDHKSAELVLKFDELPQAFADGKITIETSLASLPRIDVPVTVAVPGAN